MAFIIPKVSTFKELQKTSLFQLIDMKFLKLKSFYDISHPTDELLTGLEF